MTRAEQKALEVFGDLPNTPENQEKVADWIDGYEQAEKDTIERTVEWLEENWRNYVLLDVDKVIHFRHLKSDFRKAMEE